MVEALAEEFDEGVALRSAQAARQQLHIHCHAGCSSCCDILVTCYLPEALRIATFLQQPEQAAVKAAFFGRLPGLERACGQCLGASNGCVCARTTAAV